MNSWDGPDAFKEVVRTARKEHQCSACDETIAPGHRYVAISGVWDGSPGSFKHCLRCHAITDAIYAAGGDGVQIDLACGHDWEEAFGGPPPENVAALAFALPGEDP